MIRTKKLTDEMLIKTNKINEAMQQERMNKIMQLQGPVLFYNKLVQDGNDPNYYGKDVTAGDANAVLMTWKISNDTYRVIYGDLSIENVSAEQLKEMEQPTKQ
jgi:hypothetical protein